MPSAHSNTSRAGSEKAADTPVVPKSPVAMPPQDAEVPEVIGGSDVHVSAPAPPTSPTAPFFLRFRNNVNFFQPPPLFGTNTEERPESRPPCAHYHIVEDVATVSLFHSQNSPAQEVMGPEDTLDISSTKVTVPKLSADGSNWTTYHERILNALTSKKLRRHVTGTARRPAELIERNGKFYLTADEDAKPLSDTEIETQEELMEAWLQKEAQVREIIYGTVDQSTFLQIKGEPTIATVWKKLASIHADK
ncbi:hypothetical protein H0H92_011945, partial [Tricholoma furcatifolium]